MAQAAVARKPAVPARPAPRAPAKPVQEEAEEGNGAPTMPMTVTARTTKAEHKGRVVSTSYDFGSTLEESIEKFGENVVHGVFIDQSVIRLQALLRRCIEDAVADKDITAKVEAWKMTVGGRERKSAVEKVNDLLGKMSPEQKAELLRSIRAGK